MTEPSASLADTHCHLVLPAFDGDRNRAFARAWDAGVRWLLIPGIDLPTSRRAVEWAERYDSVYAAVGVHPHHASSWSSKVADELRALARSQAVVAVGELGLDYFRNIAPPSIQRAAFRAQLEIAAELNLPVIVHNREAIDHVLEDLTDWVAGLKDGLGDRVGVLHAFSADLGAAKTAVQAGFYVGLAGPLTYRNAEILRPVALEIPLDRLLLETDSPYLPPQPYRGQRNEPAHLRIVAEALAELRDLDIPTIAETTSRNASILFARDPDG